MWNKLGLERSASAMAGRAATWTRRLHCADHHPRPTQRERLLADCPSDGCRLMSAARAGPFFGPAPSFSRPHPAVVRVAVPERDGTASYGSGSLVAVNESSGLVLTNWHVVRDAAGPIVVYFPDGFHSAALPAADRPRLGPGGVGHPAAERAADPAGHPAAPARRPADDRRLRQRPVSRRDRANARNTSRPATISRSR